MTSRQQRVGETIREHSRQRLVLAAADLFAERGYAGTTVEAVAERAGVSLRTLYTAWGSKRRLLRAYVEFTMTGSSTGVTAGGWVPELQRRLDAGSVPDPAAQLRRVARIFREVAERMDVPWRVMRDGAAVDAGVAQDHAELERLRRRSLGGLLDLVPPEAMRPGMAGDAALDTLLVMASPSSHETLVHMRGYSPDEFERWLADTLVAVLLSGADGSR